MEKIATDIYSFRVLREKDFTYVDKTAMLLPLADMSVGKQFFIARPRRRIPQIVSAAGVAQ